MLFGMYMISMEQLLDQHFVPELGLQSVRRFFICSPCVYTGFLQLPKTCQQVDCVYL